MKFSHKLTYRFHDATNGEYEKGEIKERRE